MRLLGPTLRLARAAQGLGQGELARKVGLTPSHISLIEAGRRFPSLTTLEDITRALEMPLAMFMFIANLTLEQLDDPNNRPMLTQIGWWFLKAGR